GGAAARPLGGVGVGCLGRVGCQRPEPAPIPPPSPLSHQPSPRIIDLDSPRRHPIPSVQKNIFDPGLEHIWASQPIAPVTSAASVRTDSASAWPRSGGVKYSAAVARRAASV